MRIDTNRLMLTAILVLFTSMSSMAQPEPQRRQFSERVFVSVNGSRQLSAADFSDAFTIHVNAENGRVDSDYTVKSASSIDVTGGVLLWRDVGVAVGVTRFTRSTPTAVSASIPHPFFFGRPRVIGGRISDIDRDERAVHLQARVLIPSGPVQLMVFGGPSFHRVRQGLIATVLYDESYPYDDATFNGATPTTAETSGVGVNVGGDIAYYFLRHVGVGLAAMYAGTAVDLPAANGRTVRVDAGGLNVGGGVRLRF